MKKLLCFAMICAFFVACGKENAHEEETNFVKKQYEALMKGDYQTYVNGFDINTNAPKKYQEQLISNAKMYAKQINDNHKGIHSIELKKVEEQQNNKEANVLMEVVFKDSVRELMIVPIIKRDEEWKMR